MDGGKNAPGDVMRSAAEPSDSRLFPGGIRGRREASCAPIVVHPAGSEASDVPGRSRCRSARPCPSRLDSQVVPGIGHGLHQSGGHCRRPGAVRGLSWSLATGDAATPPATRARVVREGAVPTFRLDHGNAPAEDLHIVHHDRTPVDSSPFRLFCRTLCRGTEVMPGFRAGGASVSAASGSTRVETPAWPRAPAARTYCSAPPGRLRSSEPCSI